MSLMLKAFLGIDLSMVENGKERNNNISHIASYQQETESIRDSLFTWGR